MLARWRDAMWNAIALRGNHRQYHSTQTGGSTPRAVDGNGKASCRLPAAARAAHPHVTAAHAVDHCSRWCSPSSAGLQELCRRLVVGTRERSMDALPAHLRSGEGSCHSRFKLAPAAFTRRWPRQLPSGFMLGTCARHPAVQRTQVPRPPQAARSCSTRHGLPQMARHVQGTTSRRGRWAGAHWSATLVAHPEL